MSRGIGIMKNLALFALMLALPALAQEAANGNSIDALDVSAQAGKVTVKLSLKRAPTVPPVGFTLTNPPRIALDFPGTGNGLGRSSQDVNQGDLRTIRFGQSGTRTRVVFNLSKMVAYDTRVDGNTVVITLQSAARGSASHHRACRQRHRNRSAQAGQEHRCRFSAYCPAAGLGAPL